MMEIICDSGFAFLLLILALLAVGRGWVREQGMDEYGSNKPDQELMVVEVGLGHTEIHCTSLYFFAYFNP